MKKGIFIFILLILALFSVSCIYAADVNDTLAASEDTGEIELSHEIESADDNLGTIEEQTVTQTDNEEKTGATDDGTFEALNMKIGDASSGNTVYLENNYSCEDSWTQENGIEIYKSNLIIDGQGHTIDAKQKTRIFHVYNAENVTIKNIKFINAKINGNDGGAIKWSNGANSIISGCSFVNCSVNKYGGAICWDNIYGVHVSACSFVNCFANDYGGAIYWDLSSNGNISDCVFINNADSNGKAIYIDGFASLNCNWFGNTAENYKTSPSTYIYGANTDNWLFLNATVGPKPISIAETADIIFKLYLYNGSITDYTSLAKVDLTLNSNGKLDKNVTGLDEKVKFTPTSPGTGSVTATIGDVAYTTTLTVTDGTTFWDLNKTINGNTNDTITLDRDYAYNPDSDSAFTDGIMITRPVTINGNGHTIDAKGKKSIFYVKANNVTIKNLTIKNAYIKNGYGGAIYLGMVDGCIVSQCNFINNTAKYGGAICGDGPENSVISQCTFINNSAEYGGAIYWDSQSGNAYNCVFLNNNANDGSAIYIFPYSYLTADYCWFGNTATDYDGDLPISGSCTNWMFLNATDNPDAIAVSETSDIIFKLFLYNSTSGNITEYDNAPFENLNLTIASTNGNVSKNTAKLGEIIKYNATNIGTGSVTASIENVTYTIELNIKYRPDLSVQSQEVGYSSNTVITLVYNSTATGTVNITLKGKNRNYTFEKELNATISLGNIDADEYEVNVTYSGDNVFWNATATGKLTINKANSTLTINDNVTFDYNTNGSTTVSYTNATGVNASVIGQPNATVVVNDTTITVSGLDSGNYTLSVTTITDANHNNVTKTVNITVNKVDSTLSVSDVTLDYGTSTSVVVTTEGATGITAKINGTNATVDGFIIIIPVLDAGNYTLSVTTVPDSNHNSVTKTATIIVNKVNSTLRVDDVELDYGETINVTAIAEGATGITAKINGTDVEVVDFIIPISGLDAGNYTLTVTTIPDADHNPVTITANITVNKINSTLSVDDVELDYGKTINVTAIAEGATDITAKINGSDVEVVDFIIPISGLDAGNYTLTVTTIPDANHNPVTKTANITVNKVNSTVTVDDVELDYGETTITVTAEGATSVTAQINGVNVTVDGFTITIPVMDAGTYILTVTTIADANHNGITINATIVVNKLKTQLTASAVTATYNINKNLVATLKDSKGKPLTGIRVVVNLNGVKEYTTNKNGQIIVPVSKLVPKTYSAKITFAGNNNYLGSTANAKVVVKKAKAKIIAKKKTFKRTKKVKKYSITLKANNKPISKVKVTLKIKGKKLLKAKTNAKGKATFKIKNLKKKGTFKATVKYAGNAYYNSVTKTVKIKIK